MSNCPKAAFIGISPAKAKFSFVLENLTKVPEMVSTIFYFAKSPSRVTPLLFPSFNILFCSSQKLLRETIIHIILFTPILHIRQCLSLFLYFFHLVSTVQYITVISLAKILFFYVIHLYPISILYGFTFTALSDTSYFFHCPGIFVFIIM